MRGDFWNIDKGCVQVSRQGSGQSGSDYPYGQ